MKHLVTLTLFVFIAVNTFAQVQLNWANAIGGSAVLTYNNSIKVDASGNVYTTGHFQGSGDFDPGSGTATLTSTGGIDIFVSKFDSSGNYVWAKAFGGTGDDDGHAIAIDAAGNVYTVGNFTGTADFDPNAGTANLTSSGLNDIFIAKFDASGNYVWAKQIGGIDNDEGNSIVLDAAGAVYCTGYYRDSVDFNPGAGVFSFVTDSFGQNIFILKLDGSGNFVFAKEMRGISFGQNGGNDIALDNSGNIYTTGYFQIRVDFNPGAAVFNLPYSAGFDAFIAKLDPTGNFLWARSFRASGDDVAHSIKITPQNEAVITGYFKGTITNPYFVSAGDRDIFVFKYNSSGVLVWGKQIGGFGMDMGYSVDIDASGSIYVSGEFSSVVDFNPGITADNLTSAGFEDVFILKLFSAGNFAWAKSMGGAYSDYGHSVDVDLSGNIHLGGYFHGIADFDPGLAVNNILGNLSAFVSKYNESGVSGMVFMDYSGDCILGQYENACGGCSLTIQPGNIALQTNSEGFWFTDSLPVGSYTITVDSTSQVLPSCPPTSFTITNSNLHTQVAKIGCEDPSPCAIPDISVHFPYLRRCTVNPIPVTVSVCNRADATGGLVNPYADITLDSTMTVTSSSIPYTAMGNNVIRFQLNTTLGPGQCSSFYFRFVVSCEPAMGQTLCIEARVPGNSCSLDSIPSFPSDISPCTLPWDHSDLAVDGYCQGDSVKFTITNTGDFGGGDMVCYAPVRLFVDGLQTMLDSIMLTAGATFTYSFLGTGHTMILQTEQHPLHPGNSHPNAHVELCGNPNNFTPGFVNSFPLDDADPIVDIYCREITGSYDPNDKVGYPFGLTESHFIQPNQHLEYTIQFQNTGNDTAFSVVVRDTLDMNLDISTVLPRAASHPFTFRIYGPRVLEWTFYNILLPDSNVNEEFSHGFLTFSVEQDLDLPDFTPIHNEADIYFDFNDPVITNQTLHTIFKGAPFAVGIKEKAATKNTLAIYPNPTASSSVIEFTSPSTQKGTIIVRDIVGRTVLNQTFQALKGNNRLPLTVGKSGIFFVSVSVGEWKGVGKVVVD